MFRKSRLCHIQQHSEYLKGKIKDFLHSERSVDNVLIDTGVELSNVTETHIWNRMNSVRRNGRRNSKWDAEENVR